MTANVLRRLAVAEARANLGKAKQVVVRRQPRGMDADTLAAWMATEAPEAANVTVIILKFMPWPPRSAADIRDCIATNLCASTSDLREKVLSLPDYPEKNTALMALAS
jgi:hypothetical protein